VVRAVTALARALVLTVSGVCRQIVLDEGHRIKDARSQLSAALSKIVTKKRIVLTHSLTAAIAGYHRYPLQNHLKEYYCMVDFTEKGMQAAVQLQCSVRVNDGVGAAQRCSARGQSSRRTLRCPLTLGARRTPIQVRSSLRSGVRSS
jgi:hypothetical protein